MATLRTSLALLIMAVLSGVAWAEPPEENPSGRVDRYADPLPEGAIARCGTIRWRHVGGFLVAYRHDGKTMLSVGRKDVRLWDLANGRVIRQIDTGRKRNEAAAISKDKKLLAVVQDFREIKVFQVETGKEIHSFRPANGDHVVSISFSNDEQFLAARSHGESIPLVWRLETREMLKDLEQVKEEDLADFFGGILLESHSLEFSPDGKYLATASERGAVAVWQVATGKLVRQIKARTGGPPVIAYSPNGKLVAWGKADGGTILADTASGKELRTLQTSANCLIFSPDNNYLVSVLGTDVVEYWDVATGRLIHKLKGDLWGVHSLSFSSDGKKLAAADDCQIREWSTSTGKERQLPENGVDPITALALSPDDKTVATGSGEGAVRLWEVSTGQPTGRRLDHSHVATKLGFSPDRKTLAICRDSSEELALCDVVTGKQRSLAVDGESRIWAFAFSAKGDTLIECEDSNVRIIDTTTGKLVRHFGVPLVDTRTPDVVLGSDGGVLASYKPDAAQGREVFTDRLLPPCKVPKGVITNAAISANGRMLALAVSPIRHVVKGRAYPDLTKPADIAICELATGQERVRFTLGGSDVRPLSFSPRGDLLAYGDDTEIHLYEALSGKEVLRLLGHQGTVVELAFSTDGSKIVSGSIDTTALVWDLSQVSRTTPGSEQRLDRARLQLFCADLGGPDAAKAYRAIQILAASSDSVPFLEQELLAASRSFSQRKAQVERLIPLLDSERYAERERATRELKNLSEDAELLLRGMLAGEVSVEVRRRLTQVLGVMQGEPPSPRTLRQLRAVESLELAGTTEARRALQALTKGPTEYRLTCEAKSALERLEKWTAK